MAFTIISLPIPLLLLLHLHILEYPHANNPEYDLNIFNPRFRGLRERTKLMEDISYFLVGRVEGGKNGVKTVLPTYPCVQPSESVAFRTSLVKYLDNLRHPTSSSSSNTQAKGKWSDSDMAWWWKDVTVRKSLLEECVGEKFERVLLALSTHALMKKTSNPIAFDATSSAYHSQPFAYTRNLTNYQAKRHSWSQRASLLTRRQEDLTRLQNLLSSSVPWSRYCSSFSIWQLHAMRESILQNLLEGEWAGKEGREALNLFFELVGLGSSTDSFDLSQKVIEDIQIKQPPPLPVAAAHHPSHLRKLRRPVFQTKSSQPPSRSYAEIKLSSCLESEERMRQALVDRISQTQRHHVYLVEKLKALKLSTGSPSPTIETLNLETFQSESTLSSFDWDLKPNRDMFNTVSLPVTPEDGALETQIQHIPEELLTPYPSILPDPSALRLSSSLENVQTGSARATSSKVVPGSIKRNFLHFSMVRKGRPSLYGMQDVDQLVDATQHDSDPESDSEICFVTPKVKTKINRIWTSGTPKSKMKNNTPRESFPMTDSLFLDPALSLPSLLSSAALLDSDDKEDGLKHDADFTCDRITNLNEDKEEDVFGDDPPSMTLKEILLNVDTGHFHLLEEDEEDAVLSGDDTSFEWD